MDNLTLDRHFLLKLFANCDAHVEALPNADCIMQHTARREWFTRTLGSDIEVHRVVFSRLEAFIKLTDHRRCKSLMRKFGFRLALELAATFPLSSESTFSAPQFASRFRLELLRRNLPEATKDDFCFSELVYRCMRAVPAPQR